MVVTWFLSVMVKWEGGAYIFQTFRSPIRILGDKKQEIYWRLTNITCNHTKFRHLADQTPRIFELLLWGVATVCMLVFPWFGMGSTTASHYWPQSASSALPSGWLVGCVCARACVRACVTCWEHTMWCGSQYAISWLYAWCHCSCLIPLRDWMVQHLPLRTTILT